MLTSSKIVFLSLVVLALASSALTNMVQVGNRFPQGIHVDGSTALCEDAGDAGLLRFNNESNVLEVCDGQAWTTATGTDLTSINLELLDLRGRVESLESNCSVSVEDGGTLVCNAGGGSSDTVALFLGVQICNGNGLFNKDTFKCDCHCTLELGCWDSAYKCTTCQSGWDGDLCSQDTVEPTFTFCPGNIASTEAVVTWSPPVATDNYAISSIVGDAESGVTVFDHGTTTVTFVATDASGLQDTCSFDVQIDLVSPEWVDCPVKPLYASADEGLMTSTSVLIADYSATDSNGIAFINKTHDSLTVFPVGTTAVTWTATDTFGRSTDCNFDVVVLDTELPTWANCSTEPIILSEPQENVEWAEPTATDNDGLPVSVTSNYEPGNNNITAGAHVVVYTATDSSNNQAQCVFVIRTTAQAILHNGAYRVHDGSSLESCEAYAYTGIHEGSSVYWIQPSGSGSPFKVKCYIDETVSPNQGWTMFARFSNGYSASSHIGSVNVGSDPAVDTPYALPLANLGGVDQVRAYHVGLDQARSWTFSSTTTVTVNTAGWFHYDVVEVGDDGCSGSRLSWADHGCWAGRRAGPAVGTNEGCWNLNNWSATARYYGRAESTVGNCVPDTLWGTGPDDGPFSGTQEWYVRSPSPVGLDVGTTVDAGFSSCPSSFDVAATPENETVVISWNEPVLSSAAVVESLEVNIASPATVHNGEYTVIYTVQLTNGAQSACHFTATVSRAFIQHIDGALAMGDDKGAMPNCQEYVDIIGNGLRDGLYWIQPAALSSPMITRCKFTPGEGWTLFARFSEGQSFSSYLGYSTSGNPETGSSYSFRLPDYGTITRVLAEHVVLDSYVAFTFVTPQVISLSSSGWQTYPLVENGVDGCVNTEFQYADHGCWNGRKAGPGIGSRDISTSSNMCSNLNSWTASGRMWGRGEVGDTGNCVPGTMWDSRHDAAQVPGEQRWYIR